MLFRSEAIIAYFWRIRSANGCCALSIGETSVNRQDRLITLWRAAYQGRDARSAALSAFAGKRSSIDLMTDSFARAVLHASNVETSLDFFVHRLGFTIPWRVEWDGHTHAAEVDRQGRPLGLPAAGGRGSRGNQLYFPYPKSPRPSLKVSLFRTQHNGSSMALDNCTLYMYSKQ